MRKTEKIIFICMLLCVALVFSGCLPSMESTTIKTPEPTPEGQWAGLAYGDTEWELITYEGYEETYIYFPEYRDGMEILVYPHSFIEGCEITYWLGGTDGIDENEWDILVFTKVLGNNEYAVTADVYKGRLIQLSYRYEPKSLGFFSLRFGPEIESCVYWAEKLLSTLDPEGLEIYKNIHVERERKRPIDP
jgi:hypothetical protein